MDDIDKKIKYLRDFASTEGTEFGDTIINLIMVYDYSDYIFEHSDGDFTKAMRKKFDELYDNVKTIESQEKEDQQHIILMSGISASGKSTYVNLLSANYEVICADEIRAELGDINDQSKNGLIFNEIMPFRIQKAIVNNKDVIIDITSPDKKTRKKFIRLAKDLGVDIRSHYITPNLERSKKWNAQRDRKVPEFVLDKQFNKWSTPSLSEGFSSVQEIIIDKNLYEIRANSN